MFDVLSKVTGRGGDGESTPNASDDASAGTASRATVPDDADPGDLSPADFRERAEALAGRSDVPELDFTEAALPDLDVIATGSHPVDDALTYGSYLGETLVRAYDGEWVREDGWAVAVDLGDDRTTVAVFDAARMALERGPVFEQVAERLHDQGDPRAEPSADEDGPTTDSSGDAGEAVDADSDEDGGAEGAGDSTSEATDGTVETKSAERTSADDGPEEAVPSSDETDDGDEIHDGDETAVETDAPADADEAVADDVDDAESVAEADESDADPEALDEVRADADEEGFGDEEEFSDERDAGEQRLDDADEGEPLADASGVDAGDARESAAADGDDGRTDVEDLPDGGESLESTADASIDVEGEREEDEGDGDGVQPATEDGADETGIEAEDEEGDEPDADVGGARAELGVAPDDEDDSDDATETAVGDEIDGEADVVTAGEDGAKFDDEAESGDDAVESGDDAVEFEYDDGVSESDAVEVDADDVANERSGVVDATSSELEARDDGPAEGDFSRSRFDEPSRADDAQRDTTDGPANVEGSADEGPVDHDEPGEASAVDEDRGTASNAGPTGDREDGAGAGVDAGEEVPGSVDGRDAVEPDDGTGERRTGEDGAARPETDAEDGDRVPEEAASDEADASNVEGVDDEAEDEKDEGADGEPADREGIVAESDGEPETAGASSDADAPSPAAPIPVRNDYEPAAIQFRNGWSDYDFDFSPASLSRLDGFLDDQWDGRFRPGSLDDSSTDPAESSGPLVRVGAYVGEVLVQHYGGEWVAGDDGEPAISVAGRHGRREVFPVFDATRTSLTGIAQMAYAVDAMANRLDLGIAASDAEETAFALGDGGPGTDASSADVITTVLDRAEAFVESWPGYDLNYRPASLVRLDNLVENELDGEAFRGATLGDRTDADALRLADRAAGASAYFAAVLVRHLDAQWEIGDEVALAIEGPAGETRVVPFEGSVACLRGRDKFMRRYDRTHDAVIDESRSTG